MESHILITLFMLLPVYRLLFSYKINVHVVKIRIKSIMAQTLSKVCYFIPAVAGCPTSEIISGNLYKVYYKGNFKLVILKLSLYLL